MRFTYAALGLLVCSLVLFGVIMSAHSQGGGGDDVGPIMFIEETLDLDVFIEALNESGLKQTIEGYLDTGWTCMFLSTALETKYSNDDRLYYGCAAFQSGSDWDAVKWDYDYDDSSSQGTPSIPQDELDDRMVFTPTGTSGLSAVISDRLSWDYLLHVGDNMPNELYSELTNKDLTKVWVEHETTGTEKVLSFWKYEDATSTKTWRVWSYVTNGSFGTITVD